MLIKILEHKLKKLFLSRSITSQKRSFPLRISSYEEIIILDYFDIDWSNLLNLNEKNIDLSTNNFLNAMNSLLNKYARFKKISKYKLKFKRKPWITFGIQKSISVKNKPLKKFINKKDPPIKVKCHEKYKNTETFSPH